MWRKIEMSQVGVEEEEEEKKKSVKELKRSGDRTARERVCWTEVKVLL